MSDSQQCPRCGSTNVQASCINIGMYVCMSKAHELEPEANSYYWPSGEKPNAT